MTAAALRWAWTALKPALPWILVAVLGGLVTYCTPVIGAGAHIQRQAFEISDQKQKAKAAKERADTLAGWLDFERKAREQDSVAAATALTEERGSCAARIEQARRSSAKIQELLREDSTHETPAGICPDRRLIDPDGLREAIG